MNDRLVAGLKCSQVLARLSDYLDREVSAADRAQIEEHLKGCEQCSKFGGEFAATVRALREHLLHEPGAPLRLRARLAAALDREKP